MKLMNMVRGGLYNVDEYGFLRIVKLECGFRRFVSMVHQEAALFAGTIRWKTDNSVSDTGLNGNMINSKQNVNRIMSHIAQYSYV